MNWLDHIKWDAQGLVPVIAQEQGSKDVLMFAWMNREALQLTAEQGRAVYFSRSRGKLWFKGEESGHVQLVHDIRLDCDNDVVLLTVTQTGHDPSIACHTGRHSCFYQRWQTGPDGGQWLSSEPVLASQGARRIFEENWRRGHRNRDGCQGLDPWRRPAAVGQ